MRKSWERDNKQLMDGYELVREGKVEEALILFESMAQAVPNPTAKANLCCTIGVISISVGNYHYALQKFEESLTSIPAENHLLAIRSHSNLCLLYVLMGRYRHAHQQMQYMISTIQKSQNPPGLIQFALQLMLRVSTIEELETMPNLDTDLPLLDAFFLTQLAFSKQVCGIKGSKEILKTVYPIYVKLKNYPLAVRTLRSILSHHLPHSEVTYYKKELGKLMTLTDDRQDQAKEEALQCCQELAHQLIRTLKKIKLEKQKSALNEKVWKMVISYELKKLERSTELHEEERDVLQSNFKMMLVEKNSILMKEMAKSTFFTNSLLEVRTLLTNVNDTLEARTRKNLSYAINACKHIKVLQQQKQNSQTKIDQGKKSSIHKSKNRSKNKQNSLGISISSTQSNKQSRISIFKSTSSTKDTNKVSVKFCEYGNFLNKRNYNSDGGEYKFVRVTNSIIKWAKNPEEMEESSQIYPLKDVKSIFYGKLTQNFKKNCNKLLRPQFCFSLHLQKRTLDFYCKDYEETCKWVCGLSEKLKKVNPKIVGYNRAKMNWKKMFMIFRENFTEKLPKHKKTYYHENAYAIILFGANGYKLPEK